MNANDMSVSKLKWFTFRQNNSGGLFTIDDTVDVNVIIQANCADEANELAQRVGIYFNGVDEGYDCECCGDRWYKVWDSVGTDEPEIYGQRVSWSSDSVVTCEGNSKYGLLGVVNVYPYNIISKK